MVPKLARLVVALSIFGTITAAAGSAHVVPVKAGCFSYPCHSYSPRPALQYARYNMYGGREIDVFGDRFTPDSYARFVVSDAVTGAVVYTNSEFVPASGYLTSTGSDLNPVDGAMLSDVPLDWCGAYHDPLTGVVDPLLIRAYDPPTFRWTNVISNSSACL
jgi:hypothetical protein